MTTSGSTLFSHLRDSSQQISHLYYFLRLSRWRFDRIALHHSLITRTRCFHRLSFRNCLLFFERFYTTVYHRLHYVNSLLSFLALCRLHSIGFLAKWRKIPGVLRRSTILQPREFDLAFCNIDFSVSISVYPLGFAFRQFSTSELSFEGYLIQVYGDFFDSWAGKASVLLLLLVLSG